MRLLLLREPWRSQLTASRLRFLALFHGGEFHREQPVDTDDLVYEVLLGSRIARTDGRVGLAPGHGLISHA